MKNIDQYNESFVKITKVSQKQKKQLVSWYNKQNILIQNDVFSEKKNYYFKLRNNGISLDLIPICSFYLALKKLKKTDDLKFKNKNLNLDSLNKISNNSIKSFKKIKFKEKREKLLNYCNLIKKLRSENFSFRQISDYLRGHHRFEVSHTYIAIFLKEFKDDS